MLGVVSLAVAAPAADGVGLAYPICGVIPVDGDVEIHTNPAPVAVVRRLEIPIRISGNEGFLGPIRSGREERNAVVVVVIPERHEHASVDEPGGFTMARAFFDVRQRETELREAWPEALSRLLTSLPIR